MITTEVCISDNKIVIGGFRIHLGGSNLTIFIGREIVSSSEWCDGFLFGTLEQAVSYCLSHQCPSNSTHYKKTAKSNYRYYKKDNDGNWLTHIVKRYPLGWQPVGKFDDLTEIKPLF